MQVTVNCFTLTTKLLQFVLIALAQYRSMHIFYLCTLSNFVFGFDHAHYHDHINHANNSPNKLNPKP